MSSDEQATEPVESVMRNGWQTDMAYFAVEQINLQLDQYRWWALFLTDRFDVAQKVLAHYRRRDPDGKYRLVMSIALDQPE